MRRTIVIGDVHGCAKEFEALLRSLKLRSKDRVFQVGDLINRGPDSHRTIEIAKAYGVRCILGNHEVRLLKAREKNSSEGLKSYDYDTLNQLTKADWKFLKKMPPYIYKSKRKTVIVHAGFLPKPAWYKQDIDTITQIKLIDASGNPVSQNGASDAIPWADRWKGAPFVVYGHNPRPEVYKKPGSIGIDTGCIYGGHLTAYILENKSIIQIPAKKRYA
jgi:predicted phosphodiesterase